jgi:hypothetical protein
VLPSEGKGHKFESCRARQLGTRYRRQTPAISRALFAASLNQVKKSTLTAFTELCALLDRQVGRPLPLRNAAGVDADLPIRVVEPNPATNGGRQPIPLSR